MPPPPPTLTTAPVTTVASSPPKAHASVSTDVEKDILSVLQSNGSYVDEIAAACRISVAEALSTLTILELKGTVQQFSGKRFAPR